LWFELRGIEQNPQELRVGGGHVPCAAIQGKEHQDRTQQARKAGEGARAEDHGDEKQTSLDTVNGGAIIDHNAPRERRFVAVEK